MRGRGLSECGTRTFFGFVTLQYVQVTQDTSLYWWQAGRPWQCMLQVLVPARKALFLHFDVFRLANFGPDWHVCGETWTFPLLPSCAPRNDLAALVQTLPKPGLPMTCLATRRIGYSQPGLPNGIRFTYGCQARTTPLPPLLLQLLLRGRAVRRCLPLHYTPSTR